LDSLSILLPLRVELPVMENASIPWSPSAEVPFLVADWTVDASANRLLRDGQEVRLEPRAMSVLVYLARHRGRVVSRDELESAAWTGMVVGYDAITQSVIKLRRAMGDDSRSPRIIETISKTGYRLIAEVGPVAEPAIGVAPRGDAAIHAALRTPASMAKRRRRVLLPAAGLLALLLVVAATAVHLLKTPQHEAQEASGSPERVSIAVLPFDNPTADPSEDYFTDGITEDLITDLAKVSGLLVVARNSAFAYQNSTEPADAIGRALGVRFLLKGNLRREGQELRLNVRLIDSRDGRAIWAERYDRQLTDVFRVQDELTAQIVSALQVELAPADRRRLARNHEASVAAYDELLRGNDFYGRRSFDDNESAKAHYQRAIELDPRFARAYSALALAYSAEAFDGWEQGAPDAMERAAALVDEARNLDPTVPQIYFVGGQVALYRRDYAEAINQVEQAIALSPGYADAYALLARVLNYAGRPVEGLDEMERAMRLNPTQPSIYRMLRGALHYFQGDYPKAVDDLEQALPMNPTLPLLRSWLAAAYAGAGRIEEAQWEVEELMALNPGFSLEHVRSVYPVRDPAQLERLIADLRKAGLE
jgi:TolB-like protein/DNA-binding winged helix-turn-helix (wHTH) protein/cytochrome c-type biogenesis protein CcmH/NrfG